MKKIFKTIGLICMAVVVAVGSIFIAKKDTKNNINVASAGTTSSYEPSDFVSYKIVVFNSFSCFVPFYIAGSGRGVLYFNPIFISDLSTGEFLIDFSSSPFYLMSGSSLVSYPIYTNSSNSSQFFNINSSISSLYCSYCSFNFEFSYSSVDLDYSSSTLQSFFYCVKVYSSSSSDFNYNCFEFLSSSGFSCVFKFPASSNFKVLKDQTYYFTSDLSDDQSYCLGYQQGIADNQQNIYNQGYLAGRNVGYSEGHSAGITDSNNYSFTGLIGAVIDVPVKTILGLLDFEILGVNIFGFAVGLISFSVLLFIIRKIKGGR